MKTIISHFYNEEYLLPWWLEHHRQIFDHGIMIDYASTDQSCEIIQRLCPTWEIFPSANQFFDARACDHEVMFYERQLPGWRIALTVTEFIVGDVERLMPDQERPLQWLIPGIRFCCWDPAGQWDRTKSLWEQESVGVSYKTNPLAHQCRSLHNFRDIVYDTGRHFLPHNTEDALIFHYAHCVKGPEMLKRRLQIQNRISPSDKQEGLGNHHYIDQNGMDEYSAFLMYRDFISVGAQDCQDMIDSAVNKYNRIGVS